MSGQNGSSITYRYVLVPGIDTTAEYYSVSYIPVPAMQEPRQHATGSRSFYGSTTRRIKYIVSAAQLGTLSTLGSLDSWRVVSIWAVHIGLYVLLEQ